MASVSEVQLQASVSSSYSNPLYDGSRKTSSSKHSSRRKEGGSSSSKSSSDKYSLMDSHYKFPASRLKTDQFFLHWLSQPENQELVWQLVEDSKAGRPLRGPSSSSRATPRSPRHSPSSNSISHTPPLSPSKQSESRTPHGHRPFNSSTSLRGTRNAPIPKFYFPKDATDPERFTSFQAEASEAFAPYAGSVTARELQQLLPSLCSCPGYLGYHVVQRMQPVGDKLTAQAFAKWWSDCKLVDADAATCAFEIIRQPDVPNVSREDLLAFMQHVLKYHPGLEFLQETAEFQERYAQTVVYRILYMLDRTERGVLSLADIRCGQLAEAMAQLDQEEDINKVLRFFSYEHFYVMYCKFWELDQDHDFMIDRDDLLRYGGHGLTYRIVDRIFQEAPRAMTCGSPGKMGYEDFVYFILSEEDKTTDASLRYWHRCVDLDDDGVITSQDMRWFYEEQLHRMESASQAPVTFNDVMCQMQDMLNPEVANCFTLRDLRKGRALAGTMFNILFNLSKFVAYETRDPFVVRQERAEDPEATDWDRFARQEYIRLALEEETADDLGADQDGTWPHTEHTLLEGVVGHMREGDGGGGGQITSPSFLS